MAFIRVSASPVARETWYRYRGIGHRGTYWPSRRVSAYRGAKPRGAKPCGAFVNYNLMKRPMSQAGASNTLCAPVYFVTPAVIPALAVI